MAEAGRIHIVNAASASRTAPQITLAAKSVLTFQPTRIITQLCVKLQICILYSLSGCCSAEFMVRYQFEPAFVSFDVCFFSCRP